MPTGNTGLSFYRQGWIGATTITKTSDASTSGVQISNPNSPITYANAITTAGRTLVNSSFLVSISSAGVLTFSCDAAFSLAFTNNAGSRLGFASASYTGASTYTGETTPQGTFWPYSDDAFFYTNVFRSPAVDGIATAQGGAWHRTPGTDIKTPTLSFDISKADLLVFLSAYAKVDTPAKVDLVTAASSVTTLFVGGVMVSETSELSGFSSVDLEIAV